MDKLKRFLFNDVYLNWERERLPIQVMYISALAFVLHIVGGILEFYNYDFEIAKNHAVQRILNLCLITFGFVVLNYSRSLSKNLQFIIANCVAVAATTSIHLIYLKFLFETDGAQNVLIICAMLIIVSSTLTANFRVAFFSYTLISLLITSALYLENSTFHHQLRVLLQVQLGAFLTLLISSMLKNMGLIESKYIQIRSVSNEKIAKVAVTSNKSIDEIEELRAKKRPLGILIADWRGFQAMTESLPAEEVARIMKCFYTKAYSLMRELKINDTQLNWIGGDTLMGTFYSETDSRDEIVFKCLKYTKELVSVLPEFVLKETGFKVDFDVGLAYGEDSIFGVLGPSQDVKMTVAGAVPGRAARYEAEAKTIRKQVQAKLANKDARIAPIVVCDPIFANLAGYFNLKCKITSIEASQKDITGAKVSRIEFSRVS